MNAIAHVLNRKKEMLIASLIDVVFLLLVYFMVTATLVKKEADLPFQLPVPLVKHMPLPQNQWVQSERECSQTS